MVTPLKDLGQNFLQDQDVINNMVSLLQVQDNEDVIEIGPGLGALTRVIASNISNIGDNSNLYAIEYDARLIESLEQNFKDISSVKVIHENILDWLPQFKANKPYKIIGSIPYYITSPILKKILYKSPPPTKCVLLVQKEVGVKISAIAPKSTYWSHLLSGIYEVGFMSAVDKEMFNPVPKVDSAVIKLDIKENKVSDINKWDGFLRKMWANPRKMIHKFYDAEVLESLHISKSVRPQELSNEEVARLFNRVK